MSDPAREILERFDALSETDRNVVAIEVLRRSGPLRADIPPADLDALANGLFSALDTEESAGRP
jgi:hypothetical protein